VGLQIRDLAEWNETAADRIGQIGFTRLLAAQRVAENFAQLGCHRAAIAGSAHALPLLHRGIDIADRQRDHDGSIMPRHARFRIRSQATNTMTALTEFWLRSSIAPHRRDTEVTVLPIVTVKVDSRPVWHEGPPCGGQEAAPHTSRGWVTVGCRPGGRRSTVTYLTLTNYPPSPYLETRVTSWEPGRGDASGLATLPHSCRPSESSLP